MPHRKNPRGPEPERITPEHAAQLARALLEPIGARESDLELRADPFASYFLLRRSGPLLPCAMGITWSDALLDLWQKLQVQGPSLARFYADRNQAEAHAFELLQPIGARRDDVAAMVRTEPDAYGRYEHIFLANNVGVLVPYFEGFSWQEALNDLSLQLARGELDWLQQGFEARARGEEILRRNPRLQRVGLTIRIVSDQDGQHEPPGR